MTDLRILVTSILIFLSIVDSSSSTFNDFDLCFPHKILTKQQLCIYVYLMKMTSYIPIAVPFSVDSVTVNSVVALEALTQTSRARLLSPTFSSTV